MKLIVILFVLALFVMGGLRAYKLRMEGVETTASVVAVVREQVRRNGQENRVQEYMIVEFTVPGGKEAQARLGPYQSAPHKAGDQVRLSYHPADPRNATLLGD